MNQTNPMMKKKANVWQIIGAILAALGSLFSSLKKSHDAAHSDADPTEE